MVSSRLVGLPLKLYMVIVVLLTKITSSLFVFDTTRFVKTLLID